MKIFVLLFVVLFWGNINANAFEESDFTLERNFIRNKGQWNKEVRSASLSNTLDVLVLKDKIRFLIKERQNDKITNHFFDLSFENADLSNISYQNNSTIFNYFNGNDQSKWLTNVESFKNLTFNNLYPSIDLKLYFDKGSPRYDFVLAKNANPKLIKLNYKSHLTNSIKDNELVFQFENEILRNGKIFAFQTINGMKKQIDCKLIEKDGTFGFELGQYDQNSILVIDPLVYSSFIGGSGTDEINSIASFKENEFYVVGTSDSPDLVEKLGNVISDLQGQKDAFIGKYEVTPFGTKLVSFTMIGSGGNEFGKDIDIDASGNIAICGNTNSQDFPTVNSFNNMFGGQIDGFIVKFNSDLNQVLASGYVGGNAIDVCNALKFDSNGGIVSIGTTNSPNFKLVSGIDNDAIKGGTDAFVVKISRLGNNLDWASAFSGNADDEGNDVFIDANNDIHIIGSTRSTDFTIWPKDTWGFKNPYDKTHNGGWDAWVAKIKNGGSVMIYSTLFGGKADDFGLTVTSNLAGLTFFAGETNLESGEQLFPVQETSYQQKVSGGKDLFFASLELPKEGSFGSISQDLSFATLIGGKSDETLKGITKDKKFNAYVLYGATKSKEFPIVNNIDDKYTSGDDNFAIIMNESGTEAIYSTVFGGTKNEILTGVLYDDSGNPIYVGYTSSSDFKKIQKNSQYSYAGLIDGFVIKEVEGELNLISPESHASICQGSNVNIVWSSKNLNLDSGFVIRLTRQNSDSYSRIISTKAQKTSFVWTVPNNIELSDDYVITIGHNSGLNVSNSASFKIVAAPSIISFKNVSNKTELCPGETIHLQVEASGENLQYKWKKNGTLIQNQNTNSLIIENVSESNAGTYIANVSGACEPTLVTSEYNFSILKSTQLLQDIESLDSEINKTVTFEVKADGTDVKYQWKKDNNNIIDSTRSKLVLSNLKLGDAGTYSCEITGKCGTVSSFEAKLKVSDNSSVATEKNESDIFALKGTNNDFQLYAKDAVFVNIQIMDLTGSLIQSVSNVSLNQGWQQIDLINQTISSGTYILIINSSKSNFASPIQIVR